MATLNHTSNPAHLVVWELFAPEQEPLVQKLIIVPLYIQCETAGGETQCAGFFNLTATVQNMLHFYTGPQSELSHLILYWLLLAPALKWQRLLVKFPNFDTCVG